MNSSRRTRKSPSPSPRRKLRDSQEPDPAPGSIKPDRIDNAKERDSGRGRVRRTLSDPARSGGRRSGDRREAGGRARDDRGGRGRSSEPRPAAFSKDKRTTRSRRAAPARNPTTERVCSVIREILLLHGGNITWANSPLKKARLDETRRLRSDPDNEDTTIELQAGTILIVSDDDWWAVAGVDGLYVRVGSDVPITHSAPDHSQPISLVCGGFVMLAALEAGHITLAEYVATRQTPEPVLKVLCELDPAQPDYVAPVEIVLTDVPDEERDSAWTAQVADWTPAMQAGNIVIWEDNYSLAHIAIATGDGDYVFSLWNQPSFNPVEVPVATLISKQSGNATTKIRIYTPRWHAGDG